MWGWLIIVVIYDDVVIWYLGGYCIMLGVVL